MPVSITGTFAPSTTALINPAPPRGISTSTRPRAAIISLVTSRPPSTRATASVFTPAFLSPSRRASTQTRFDSMAELEPRSRAALPDLRHNPAASAVTFGRFS